MTPYGAPPIGQERNIRRPAPIYLGLIFISWCLRLIGWVGVLLGLAGVVILVRGVSNPIHQDFGKFAAMVNQHVVLSCIISTVGGLVLAGAGEIIAAVRDVARNSFRWT